MLETFMPVDLRERGLGIFGLYIFALCVSLHIKLYRPMQEGWRMPYAVHARRMYSMYRQVGCNIYPRIFPPDFSPRMNSSI